MANKSEAQTVTLLQECVRLEDGAQSYLSGTHSTNMDSLSTAIDAGDDVPEDAEMRTALDAVNIAADAFYESIKFATAIVHKHLGRLAGSSDLSDRDKNLSEFEDYLNTNAQALESRGLTKFTSGTITAGGSNTGDGEVSVLNTDPNGVELDVSHPATISLKCITSSEDGSVGEGNEVFLIEGTAVGDRAWEEGGIGSDGSGYEFAFGDGVNDFSRHVTSINSPQEIAVVGASPTNANQILANGDFEQTLQASGTSKVPSWTITTGDTVLSAETTTPIRGSQSLTASDAVVMTQPVTNVKPRVPYVLAILVDTPDGATTGSLTVKLKDDSTTHGTLTCDVSTITPGTPKLFKTEFIPTTAFGENVVVEISVPNASQDIDFDNVRLAQIPIIDGGRALAIIDGLTPFRYNDTLDGATTSTDAGKNQRFMNIQYGRGFKHAGVAVTWSDPA